MGGYVILIRRMARARRFILRISRATGAITLTMPEHASEAQARVFIQQRLDWIAETRAQMPPPIPLDEGATLPVEGMIRRVQREKVLRPQIRPDVIALPPGRRAVGPVVEQVLRSLARVRFTDAVARHAATLGVTPAAITLRDPRGRWGSCTHDGRLMFSWRVVMAPPWVLDYLAAHEVAHIRHFDHSPAFWNTVRLLCPQMDAGRNWFKSQGGQLHRYRFDAPGRPADPS